jgi:hypothetical protein
VRLLLDENLSPRSLPAMTRSGNNAAEHGFAIVSKDAVRW